MPEWPGTPTEQAGSMPLLDLQTKRQQWPGQPVQQPQQWPGQPAQTQQSGPLENAVDPITGRLKITVTPLQRAVEPLTSLPGEYAKQNLEARQRMSTGVEKIGTKGKRLEGALDVGFGAMDFALSPITAPIHTIVGKPIEQTTGIPHQYTEFATQLAIPGIGLIRAGSVFGQRTAERFEKILSPTTMSPKAGEAEASLRAAGGQAARDTATTEAGLEQYRKIVNALPDAEKLGLDHYIEARSSGVRVAPELQPVADSIRDAMQLRRTKLEALPETQQMQFVEDYLSHFWKDPKKAAKAFNEWRSGGVSKQGSGASLRKRTVPTIADGIAMGLEPLTKDPIEMTLRYVQSMDRFIASTEVLGEAVRNGTIKYVKPKTMGASGHPDSFRVPEGYVAIQGRGSTRADGARAYAPADWARIYNNFHDPGWHKSEAWGPVLDTIQRGSNAITALELGLSGYHAFTMANEAIISSVAKGISEIAGGKPIKGVGSISTAAFSPISLAHRGKKVQDVYLGRSPGSTDYRQITDLLTQAGGRAFGARHAPDYSFTAMDNYWTAWKRGALKQQTAESFDAIRNRPVVGTVKETANLIGRSMATVAYPLFTKYIPLIKNGAFYDTMHSWLAANPSATREQQVAMARKVWDSIDNRFGEVVQDNIFWNKTLKQSATLGMRSYSWNLGTIREIGGGTIGALKDPRKLSIAHKDYDPRVAYVVALPIVVATMNAVYQKLMTGKDPEQVTDMMAGRTGGTVKGFGGRGTVPERVVLPGYQKDVFGWWMDAEQEAINKVARGPAMLFEILRNKDWRGDPIADLNAPPNRRLEQYFGHVLQSMTPISLQQFTRGREKGSQIGVVGGLMGERSAPAYLQDPKGYTKGMEMIRRRAWRGKERHDIRQEQRYGGPE